jgi:hypothetical protein
MITAIAVLTYALARLIIPLALLIGLGTLFNKPQARRSL